MAWLQAFFSTPARQALGWTVLGIIGIGMAAGGVWFLTDDGGGTKTADADDRTPTTVSSPSATATRTNTATPSATASATPSPEPTATATPTTRPATNTNTSTGGGNNNQAPAPEPTPVPTQPPLVAGGPYCPSSDQSFPPNSIFGLFQVGGGGVPAGATVSIAFDGVIGPSRTTTDAGGYRVDYNASTSDCANRVGASISVVYNGVFYSTGYTVGAAPAIRFDIIN